MIWSHRRDWRRKGSRGGGRCERLGVCAEHPPLTCTQLESALYCPGRMEMKPHLLYCASELMGSWLHPAPLGAPKKPRTPYHTGGLTLAFADPRREPTLPPQVNPVSDGPERATNNTTRQSKVLGTQHPRTGFLRVWGSGQPNSISNWLPLAALLGREANPCP